MKGDSNSKTLRLIHTALVLAFCSACSSDSAEWAAHEHSFGKKYPATSDDLVFVCWQKPVETYEQLGTLQISLNEEDFANTDKLGGIVTYMQKKAAQWGANALWLQHAKGKSIYTRNGDIAWKNFILKDPKKITDKINTPFYIEGFALILDDTHGTHGSDEFMGEAPLEVEQI